MSGGLSAGVAILKASWASLKIKEEEWMFFWMASSTVRNLNMSPGKKKKQKKIINKPTLLRKPSEGTSKAASAAFNMQVG